MDPTANLDEQRRLFKRIHAIGDQEEISANEARELRLSAARIADLAEALDEWISRGGFLPDPWRKANAVPA